MPKQYPTNSILPLGTLLRNALTGSGSAAQGRWMGDQYGCNNPQGDPGCCADQQTDQSTAVDDLAVHDPLTRTHRTAPPALPASVTAPQILPLNNGIEAAMHTAIKEEFFNTISSVQTFPMQVPYVRRVFGNSVDRDARCRFGRLCPFGVRSSFWWTGWIAGSVVAT